MADCRECIHFVPASRLPEDTLINLLCWVERNRPGEKLLGYCNAYNRAVTYYTGPCPRFTRPSRAEGCLKLDAFLEG